MCMFLIIEIKLFYHMYLMCILYFSCVSLILSYACLVLTSKPWRQIFTHPASVTLLLNFWTFGWIGYMVLTEMPSYLNDELGKRRMRGPAFVF
jgi:hypothetical protein